MRDTHKKKVRIRKHSYKMLKDFISLGTRNNFSKAVENLEGQVNVKLSKL